MIETREMGTQIRMELENLEDEARAGLLTYLIVGQLVARARTGAWLRTDHLVELLHIWENIHGALFDWLERVRLGLLAEEVADGFAHYPQCRNSEHLTALYTDDRQLDYETELVMRIHEASEAALQAE